MILVGALVAAAIVHAEGTETGWPAPREALAMAWSDTVWTLTGPARWDGASWAIAGGSLAVTGGVGAGLDQTDRDHVLAHPSRAQDHTANVLRPFGAEYSFGILGVFALEGWALDDRRSQDIAFDGAVTSALAAGVLCNVLKVAVGRSRPFQAPTPWHVKPLSGRMSFPSGHTTQAASVLSVVACHFDSWAVKGAAAALTIGVGWSRVYNNKHWTSDVLAGGILGTAVGSAVVRLNRRLRETPSTSSGLRPWLAPDGSGGGLVFSSPLR